MLNLCHPLNILNIYIRKLGRFALNNGIYTNEDTLRPRQNGCRFAHDTFKRIFLNENVRISIKISLKFVPKDPINNNPTLVLIMAWRWPGDKSLSEPMMVSLLMHVCITCPHWVNHSTWWNDIHQEFCQNCDVCIHENVLIVTSLLGHLDLSLVRDL